MMLSAVSYMVLETRYTLYISVAYSVLCISCTRCRNDLLYIIYDVEHALWFYIAASYQLNITNSESYVACYIKCVLYVAHPVLLHIYPAYMYYVSYVCIYIYT